MRCVGRLFMGVLCEADLPPVRPPCFLGFGSGANGRGDLGSAGAAPVTRRLTYRAGVLPAGVRAKPTTSNLKT
jgi:hypothetical protein